MWTLVELMQLVFILSLITLKLDKFALKLKSDLTADSDIKEIFLLVTDKSFLYFLSTSLANIFQNFSLAALLPLPSQIRAWGEEQPC